MRSYFDCVPCAIRQALDAARMTTDDEAIHDRVVREALRMALEMDYNESPPVRAQGIHRMIREWTGVVDPYYELKRRYNALAMEMYPAAKDVVEGSADSLDTAVRLAAAGNIIDFGVNSTVSEEQVREALDASLGKHLDGEVLEQFRGAVAGAREILYLGDNAGEIVFDKLLIEQIGPEKVTFVVKAGPILNDALLEDAQEAGLSDLGEVIDNGDDAPGTIIERCSEDFRERFGRADVVVSKGQGNYETLSDVERDVFFLLQAKCGVIAKHLNCEVGSLVLQRSDPQIAVNERIGERG